MNSLPAVTVILPVRNEINFIERSLGAVLSQDYPSDLMEVIVTDGMSTDGTREVIENLQAQHDNLTVIDNAGKIVPTGLNAALRLAKGQVIIRVDGHCEIATDYVARCVQHLLEDGVEGVGGPIHTIGETTRAHAIALAMSSSFGVGGAAFRTVRDRKMFVETVAFPAYTREAIEKAGFFDEELVRNQDDEYNYRLLELGGRILLSPDIHSRYYSRSSLTSLWRQYFQYGIWKVRVMQKHPLKMRPRHFVPFLFSASLLVSFLLAIFFVIGKWMFGFVLSSYIIANVGASILNFRRGNWRVMALIPITFAILHLAYGFGFMLGLVKFWDRWAKAETICHIPKRESVKRI